MALVTDEPPQGEPRRANFAGGWGVAFDLPGLRSAYGLAGTGLLEEDGQPFRQRRERLAEQWPYFRSLPRGGFAGYGLEGGKSYGRDNRRGVGENSLAYVIYPDQACTYNVWSRLGREHLESLLDSLRPIETS